jgi:mannitol/fructose-specific phosphotransferase system IIA component (Ntr-type)
MTLGQFTEPKLLIPHLLSNQQDGVIQELTQRLESTERIQNAPAFLEAVLKRESQVPTFIEDGVAIPHVRSGAVGKLSVAVGLSAPGIPWGRDNRCIAKVVFLFAVPLTEAQAYLSLLSGLSALTRNEMAFAAFRRATQPAEMLGVLNTIPLMPMPAT